MIVGLLVIGALCFALIFGIAIIGGTLQWVNRKTDGDFEPLLGLGGFALGLWLLFGLIYVANMLL